MFALKKTITRLVLSGMFSVSAFADASNGDLFGFSPTVFSYVAANYPVFFPGTPQVGTTGDYNYAYYPSTGNYIGTSNGNVYISGPAVTGGAIKYYGAISNLMPAITQWQATGTLSLLTGLEGPQGRTGSQGPQGPTGLECPRGYYGMLYGLNGATGATGSAGAQGTQGNAGNNGANGAAGTNGTNGTNGSSFVYSMTCGAGGTDACKIGAVGPGGGWIFFVDYNDQYTGFDYLEAAATDIALVAWCVGGTAGSTATIYSSAPSVSQYWVLNRVGTGSVNTAAMKAACTSGAAYSATAYVSSPVKTDWFLGSEGEMMLMYTNLRQAGVGGFANNNYWSSTEYSSTYAWFHGFSNGNQNGLNKSNTYLVRAVRAF